MERERGGRRGTEQPACSGGGSSSSADGGAGGGEQLWRGRGFDDARDGSECRDAVS